MNTLTQKNRLPHFITEQTHNITSQIFYHMKKFNELSKKAQDLAKKEFEAQGLAVNLDLAVNALPEVGNFDWKNALQPYEFWYSVAVYGETRAFADHFIDPAPKPKKTPKKTIKKTTKKSEKKA